MSPGVMFLNVRSVTMTNPSAMSRLKEYALPPAKPFMPPPYAFPSWDPKLGSAHARRQSVLSTTARARNHGLAGVGPLVLSLGHDGDDGVDRDLGAVAHQRQLQRVSDP